MPSSPLRAPRPRSWSTAPDGTSLTIGVLAKSRWLATIGEHHRRVGVVAGKLIELEHAGDISRKTSKCEVLCLVPADFSVDKWKALAVTAAAAAKSSSVPIIVMGRGTRIETQFLYHLPTPHVHIAGHDGPRIVRLMRQAMVRPLLTFLADHTRQLASWDEPLPGIVHALIDQKVHPPEEALAMLDRGQIPYVRHVRHVDRLGAGSVSTFRKCCRAAGFRPKELLNTVEKLHLARSCHLCVEG